MPHAESEKLKRTELYPFLIIVLLTTILILVILEGENVKKDVRIVRPAVNAYLSLCLAGHAFHVAKANPKDRDELLVQADNNCRNLLANRIRIAADEDAKTWRPGNSSSPLVNPSYPANRPLNPATL